MANNIVLNPQRGDSIALTGVTSVYNQPSAFQAIGTTTYSTASIAGNANNALAGKAITITGFTSAGNNGTFLVLSSTATRIVTNNPNGVVVTAAATAVQQAESFPTSYSSGNSNVWSNQNGENAVVNCNTGDLLVAVVVGLKSYRPFDLLHGSSPAFGYLQGLNDFNANPTITDNSSGATSSTVTAVNIAKNSYALTSVNSIANITATSAATVSYTLSAAANASGGSTVYTGTGFSATANALKGYIFTITGFDNAANNGTFTCSASTSTTITLNNSAGVADTHAATASANILTITSTLNPAYGASVYLSGTNEANLNGTTVTAVGIPSGTSFVANTTLPAFTHATDTGTAAVKTTSGSTVYTGTITGGASNAYSGFYFTVAGFANNANNGTYLCTASTATTLTLSNANGIGQTATATATDLVLTLTATNSFTTTGGQTIKLAGFKNATFLNGQLQTIVSATSSAIKTNYSQYIENYSGTETAATASLPSGNTWTLVTNSNIIGSDYTVTSTPPTAPNPYPSAKSNQEGFFPSIYIYVAQNVVAGTYTVNCNSMYQPGIDDPQGWSGGAVPIFDGGVNFRVFSFSGAATSSAVDASSISLTDTTSNPATAPSTLTTTATNGDMLFSVGLMKNGNTFGTGTVGGTATSLTLTAANPLTYGAPQFAPQNFGGTVYTGTITGGANNAFAGYQFTVAGFTHSANNGTFTCTASTATTLTLANGNGIAETHAGTAAYTAPMTRISQGKLINSEGHFMIAYALTAAGSAGTFNPGFSNPLGYPMLVASVAIKSS